MEITKKLNKQEFTYFGKGIEYAIIFFKNLFLTIFTLGIYYPWAKVERLKYHYQSTSLDGSRFTFTGTGKEVFKGFIKVYLFFVGLYLLMFFSGKSGNMALVFITFTLFYGCLILLIPFAIHGAAKYRASRSSWKGIHFNYFGDRKELFWMCVKGTLLSLVTFGIYGCWFSVDLRKYILKHLEFGNLKFDFKGSGDKLFWMNLKLALFFYPTLGIYTFWYQKNLWKFYAENTEITQDGRQVKFGFNMEAGDIFRLVFVNVLLIVFTLGIATPWVVVRTFKTIFKFLYIEEGLDTESIEQSSIDNYNDASGDDFLEVLDFDFL